MNSFYYTLAAVQVGAILAATIAIIAVTRHNEKANPDLEILRRDIERQKKKHGPVKHLRKQLVEGVRKELMS